MKPSKAMQHLQFVVDTQKTVSTNKIRDMVEVIVSHNKMLETDNKRLRRRIKKMREEPR